jgi:hypothetical protein
MGITTVVLVGDESESNKQGLSIPPSAVARRIRGFGRVSVTFLCEEGRWLMF